MARKSGSDAPLLGASDARIEACNRAARAMLKLDGTLHGPCAVVAGNELAVGELVRIGGSDTHFVDVDGIELPPAGVFGTVETTDPDRAEITIDFAISGRRRIAIASPAASALAYGYAECAASTQTGPRPARSCRAIRTRTARMRDRVGPMSERDRSPCVAAGPRTHNEAGSSFRATPSPTAAVRVGSRLRIAGKASADRRRTEVCEC